MSAAANKFREGQFVRYTLEKLGKGRSVEAVIHGVHGDGTVTVEARYLFNRTGERAGGYLGYRYRYPANLLAEAA